MKGGVVMAKISTSNAAKSVGIFKACARLVKDPNVSRVDKIIMCTWYIYLLSPIDPVPELLLGPIGVVDDVGVGFRAAYLIFQAHKYYRYRRDLG
jgi:uncharacterized membrane protein YkvA (DUF1232 family)